MSHDVLRVVAVLAAVAVVTAPHWSALKAAAARALEAGKEKAGLLRNVAVAALLLAAFWDKIPKPHLPHVPVSIHVDAPSADMQQTVRAVSDAFRNASPADRMLWAAVWSKAAIVVAGDAVSTDVVFSSTKSLRGFTVLALEIGWRRIGGNQAGKYAGLRAATESAFATVLGTAEAPVTPELRARYAELCRALAWAGINEG